MNNRALCQQSFDPVPAVTPAVVVGRAFVQLRRAGLEEPGNDARAKSAWHLDHDHLVETPVLRTLPARLHEIRAESQLASGDAIRTGGTLRPTAGVRVG